MFVILPSKRDAKICSFVCFLRARTRVCVCYDLCRSFIRHCCFSIHISCNENAIRNSTGHILYIVYCGYSSLYSYECQLLSMFMHYIRLFMFSVHGTCIKYAHRLSIRNLVIQMRYVCASVCVCSRHNNYNIVPVQSALYNSQMSMLHVPKRGNEINIQDPKGEVKKMREKAASSRSLNMSGVCICIFRWENTHPKPAHNLSVNYYKMKPLKCVYSLLSLLERVSYAWISHFLYEYDGSYTSHTRPYIHIDCWLCKENDATNFQYGIGNIQRRSRDERNKMKRKLLPKWLALDWWIAKPKMSN